MPSSRSATNARGSSSSRRGRGDGRRRIEIIASPHPLPRSPCVRVPDFSKVSKPARSGRDPADIPQQDRNRPETTGILEARNARSEHVSSPLPARAVHLAKVGVAGSNPVVRSEKSTSDQGQCRGLRSGGSLVTESTNEKPTKPVSARPGSGPTSCPGLATLPVRLLRPSCATPTCRFRRTGPGAILLPPHCCGRRSRGCCCLQRPLR